MSPFAIRFFPLALLVSVSGSYQNVNTKDLTPFFLHEVKEMKQEILSQELRIQQLQKENEFLKNGVEDSKIKDSLKMLLLLKERSAAAATKRQSNAHIAFHASLDNKINNIPDDTVIKFDSIYVNEGNGYSSQTGVFTCNEPGVYMFHTNLLVKPHSYLEGSVMLNDHSVLGIYAGNSRYFANGGNMILLQLNPGDRVWVQVHGHYHSETNLSEWWPTFSGIRLFG